MLSNYEILIVEDDASLGLALKAVLSVYNSVSLASSLAEAKHAVSEKTGLDIVLVDKRLPDGEGIAIVSEIREKFPKAAIIILTGDQDYRSVTRCLEAGADDYIVKSDQTLQELLIRIPVATAAAEARVKIDDLKLQIPSRLPKDAHEVSKKHLTQFLENAERAYLERALILHEQKTTTVARKLGLGRSTLFKKIHDLKISRQTVGIKSSYGLSS